MMKIDVTGDVQVFFESGSITATGSFDYLRETLVYLLRAIAQLENSVGLASNKT